ncbi:MAG: hypothetical protein NZ570_05765 [Candidatus Caldarchaeum sp.]|nr:hypothetical protein [Candidatus Caldarchaeum sp.]MDW8358956.1 hypothetical protein [Candidatus Caldarchaeum sp.]
MERRFRELAMKKFGYGRGALSKAATEAISNWIQNAEEAERTGFEGDPVDAIAGVLSDIDMQSVELQHRASEAWRLRVLKHAPNRH